MAGKNSGPSRRREAGRSRYGWSVNSARGVRRPTPEPIAVSRTGARYAVRRAKTYVCAKVVAMATNHQQSQDKCPHATSKYPSQASSLTGGPTWAHAPELHAFGPLVRE